MAAVQTAGCDVKGPFGSVLCVCVIADGSKQKHDSYRLFLSILLLVLSFTNAFTGFDIKMSGDHCSEYSEVTLKREVKFSRTVAN